MSNPSFSNNQQPNNIGSNNQAHTRNRKGRSSTLIVILMIVALIAIFFIKRYNKMVNLQEAVNTSWSQVESQYQRRADLIPNLVETVKGYASHERETLEGVIEARSKATANTIDPSKMTEEQLANFQATQDQLTNALGRLMVVVERYPELKADENFRQLQAQLEGTENRIAVARMDFNNVAKEYNTNIRRFPNNIAAGIFGFKTHPYFKATEGAEKAPEVKF